MKKYILNISILTAVGLLGFTLSSFTIKTNMKQQKTKKLVVPHDGEIINASADAVWAIVGKDFANAGKWATSVDHSVGSGSPEFEGASCSTRSCDLNAKGFSSIKEKLIQYDDEKRELTYDVYEGFPGFVIKASNHWTVIPLTATTSKVKFDITMEMKPFMGAIMGGMMKKNLNSTLPVVANDLKVYAETGEISEAKKQRMASLNR
jgi:hypothetical protein